MGISRCNYAIQPATRKSPPLPFQEEGGEDPLTHAGTGRHCRTCRARERTRVWPVDRSSRSRRSRRSPPLSTLRPSNPPPPPLIERRPAPRVATIHEGWRTLSFRVWPRSPAPSCHPVPTFQRTRHPVEERERSRIGSSLFFPSGDRSTGIEPPLSWDTLNRVQKVLDSFKSGEKRILKRDSGWGLVVFFFFSPPCLFIGKCIRCASLGLRCRAFVQCVLNQRKAWRILCFFYDDWYKYSNIWVYINKIY